MRWNLRVQNVFWSHMRRQLWADLPRLSYLRWIFNLPGDFHLCGELQYSDNFASGSFVLVRGHSERERESR